ncbi:MAG: S49 family peptidase [Pseudomonadota bacterium]
MRLMGKLKFWKKTSRVAVIPLTGVIAAGARGLGGSQLSDAALAPVIERAFRKGKPSAVALAINSPGGSPVQSSLIGARIRRLADKLNLPVYAFCEDVAASGGYWLACAADEIFVDPSSIVGSIGVISASFGFHELLERQGIERRVHTAGENKSLMDPFKPEQPDQVERLKALQAQIHQTFIDHVKTSRGGKLPDKDLFTGEVWVGQSAVETGLADGIAHLVPKMQELYGQEVRFINYGQKKSFAQRFGLSSLMNPTQAIEERAEWSRYGL